jgi:hypothetical protein
MSLVRRHSHWLVLVGVVALLFAYVVNGAFASANCRKV